MEQPQKKMICFHTSFGPEDWRRMDEERPDDTPGRGGVRRRAETWRRRAGEGRRKAEDGRRRAGGETSGFLHVREEGQLKTEDNNT